MGSKNARLRKRREQHRRQMARSRRAEREQAENERLARLTVTDEDAHSDDDVETVIIEDDGKVASPMSSHARRMERHGRNADRVHDMVESARETEATESNLHEDDKKTGPELTTKPWVRVVAIVAAVATLASVGAGAFFSMM